MGLVRRCFWTGLGILMVSGAFTPVVQGQLQPLSYNHPGLEVDLGVGLWAWPLPMDFDGDGDLDLVVNCPDKPSNGVYFFENASGDTRQNPMPVFMPGRRISVGRQNVQISYSGDTLFVMTPGQSYPDFRKSGLANPVSLGVSEQVHPGKTRANMWRRVDFNGDQKTDLVVGVGDWSEYGWDNAWDSQGNWINGPLHGWVYVALNQGSEESPVFGKFEKVLAAGQPVDVYGWPSPNFADFDQDGDLDLLCGEFLDGFTYFENVGTRQQPRYAAGQRMKLPDGRPLTMDLQMITPTALDWDRDGDVDLIVGDEDGRVAWLENTGKVSPGGQPKFQPPRYFQQKADTLKFGALSTPWAIDWDADGDQDILCGNTAGYIGWFENLGRFDGQVRWNRPHRLKAEGQTIRIQAGKNGSIQGPAEAKWGYTTLSIADWDGDGLPDLIVNSIWGRVQWYRNLGPPDQPSLAAAQPLEVAWRDRQPELKYGWLKPEGLGLLTQWRTTPVAVDWDQDHRMDLVMLDHEGYLAWFRRSNLPTEHARLLPPVRVFVDVDGKPLQLNNNKAGGSGRRKIDLVDWDGDGRRDLLVNSTNAAWYRQIGFRDGTWVFERQGDLDSRPLSSHTTSPTTIDLNANGKPDLLIGAEDGRLYYGER